MISNIWLTERGRTYKSYLVYHEFIEHVFNEFSFLLHQKLNGFFTQIFFQNIEILKGRFNNYL